MIYQDILVVVLMGGLGTRLREQTQSLPKAMVNVHGKPFFYYQLELFKRHHIKNFVFCVGYGSQAIKEYFGDGRKFGVAIRYSEDGERLLGTAGALKKAQPSLGKDFMVCYGDSYMDMDYSDLWHRYEGSRSASGRIALMSILRNRNQFEKSNVVFKNGVVANYDKKRTFPEMEYVDYGVSAASSEIFDSIPEDQATDLSDVYNRLSQKQQLCGYEVYNRFFEIGTPSSLNEFRDLVKRNILTKMPVVFLDRDGTINEVVGAGSPLKEDQLRLLPGAVEAMRTMQSMGYRLVIVTNQPGAAKGQTSLDELRRINARLSSLLQDSGVKLDAVFACFHHPTGADQGVGDNALVRDCDCRKPVIGLFEQAVQKLNIDLDASYMVGDSAKDVLAGKKMQLKTVSVGKEAGEAGADLSFGGLYEFAKYLEGIKHEKN